VHHSWRPDVWDAGSGRRLTRERSPRYGVFVDWRDPKQASGDPPVLGTVEPLMAERTRAVTGNGEGDWLCAWCLNRVANENARFPYEGRDEFEFTNPAGLRFEIITFSPILGCRQTGKPTLEDTWFPGHAWSFCQCETCGQHLGWFYAGPQEFAGLIKNRIVRAIGIRN